MIYCHHYWKSSCRWFDSAPWHHFPKQYQRLNFPILTLCACDSKTHQTHTFSSFCLRGPRGSTLCLQPIENTDAVEYQRHSLCTATRDRFWDHLVGFCWKSSISHDWLRKVRVSQAFAIRRTTGLGWGSRSKGNGWGRVIQKRTGSDPNGVRTEYQFFDQVQLNICQSSPSSFSVYCPMTAQLHCRARS